MSKFTIMTGAIMMDDPKSYPDLIGKLNKDIKEKEGKNGKVHELYGSLRSSFSGLPTARPDFRLENRDWEYLEKYVEACHKNDLIFNYTMNSNFLGNLDNITEKYDEIIASLKRLESIKVDRVTVSHPILLDIVSKNTNLKIEVSTISNINSLQAPRELKRRYPNINKICMGIDKNRNIDFVTNMNKVCKEEGILLEIMVSEFCAIGFMSCSQLHRNHCYNMHSLNMNEEQARKGKSDINGIEVKQPTEVAGYPWTTGKIGCIFGRAIDPHVWLSTKTIWPNEIMEYVDKTGISQIKVTNRTAPWDWAIKLTEFYATGSYDGLLSQLWLSLQASTLSSRENFNKIQENSSNNVTYTCKELSRRRELEINLYSGNEWHKLKGMYNFMDIFFIFSEVDWSDIIWVDKPDDMLLEYESNWIYKWHRILTEN